MDKICIRICSLRIFCFTASYYVSKIAYKCSFVLNNLLSDPGPQGMRGNRVVILGSTEEAAHLWPEVQGRLNVFVLGAGSPPGVVEFEALVTEAGSAV